MTTRWPIVELRDVLRLDLDTVQVDAATVYPMVGVLSFGRGLFDREAIANGKTSYRTFYRLSAEHVVMSQLFGWEGALALSGPEFAGKFLSPQFPTFVCDSTRLDRRFLGWFMRRPTFWAELGSRAVGMGDRRRTLAPEALFKCKLPLPPLVEQERIVSQVQASATAIEEATRLRREACGKTADLVQSYLTRCLTTRELEDTVRLPQRLHDVRRGVSAPPRVNDVAEGWTVPDGWRCLSVAELLICGALLDVKDGNHGANHPRASEFVDDGIPFLMASDIKDGAVRWKETNRLGPATISRLRVGFARAGDVLFTHKASIGKTAIADRECVLSPQVTYYRCDPEYIFPRWLEAFLRSPLFLSQLTEIQSQSTRDFVSISKQYQQFLLLPPIREQHRIVTDIDAMQEQLAALNGLQGDSETDLNILLRSILDQAFNDGL